MWSLDAFLNEFSRLVLQERDFLTSINPLPASLQLPSSLDQHATAASPLTATSFKRYTVQTCVFVTLPFEERRRVSTPARSTEMGWRKRRSGAGAHTHRAHAMAARRRAPTCASSLLAGESSSEHPRRLHATSRYGNAARASEQGAADREQRRHDRCVTTDASRPTRHAKRTRLVVR